MTNNSNILDPSAILGLLPSLLPQAEKLLASPADAIAALVHSALTALAFRLVASESNVLPVEWNKNGPSHYSFKYRHGQSSLEFVINVSALGTRTVVNAIALEVCRSEVCNGHLLILIQSDKVATFDISTSDFTSPSFYPCHLDASNQQPLVHGFISSNRIADLISQFKLKIVQKLLPGLQKEGYVEESTTTPSSSSARPPSQDQRDPRPQPLSPPNAPESTIYPRQTLPRNPLEIGRRDLEPFPTNPFAPPSMFPPHSGDGMFVGPDHPIFGSGVRRPFADSGPWGGDGFLPPLGAPPGARFDPVGPGPRFGGRLPGRRNMQDPDNDDFIPPGVVSHSSNRNKICSLRLSGRYVHVRFFVVYTMYYQFRNQCINLRSFIAGKSTFWHTVLINLLTPLTLPPP